MSQTETSPLPSLMNPGAALLDPVRGPAQAVTALLVAAAGLLVFLLVWAALARLDRVGPEAASRSERIMLAECHRLRAAALAKIGDADAARAALMVAVEEAERRGAVIVEGRARADLDALEQG